MILTSNSQMTFIMIGLIAFMLVSCSLIIYFQRKKDKKLENETKNDNGGLYHNEITNLNQKIQLANSAITLLINSNKLTPDGLRGTKVEFAYLLSNKYSIITLFKIITSDNQTYYFSSDNTGSSIVALDNNKFNDGIFYMTQKQMFEQYNITDYNEKDYQMTLGNS